MNTKRIALSAIFIAIGIGGISAIHQGWHERQDLHAKWRIEINKSASSINQFHLLSRNFESEYFSKDFPAFFYSSAANKRERADVSCRFTKETNSSIFHECTAKANVNGSLEFDQLEAWIYRISIPGYERKDSKMLARLIAVNEAQIQTPIQDFVDPVNHPEKGSPEIQRLLVPAVSSPTRLNYKRQRIFDLRETEANQGSTRPDRSILDLLVMGVAATGASAIIFKGQRKKLAFCSLALSSLATLELASALIFQNPLPRNALTKKWRLADIIDNIALNFQYQQLTNGLRGKELVDRAWSRINSSPKIIESINPKVNGLLFGEHCQGNRADNIDLLIVGASVAEGWGASHINQTLWNRVSTKLNTGREAPICVGVKARPGINSDTELQFVSDFLTKEAKPSAIALIHAQNDIINPVFNVLKKPMGVDENFRSLLIESADKFLVYSAEIRRIASKNNVHVFEFMPPSALDKQPLSNDEKSILIGYASHKSYDWTLPGRLLNTTFDRIASNLRLIDRINEDYTFIDGRRSFEGEQRSMFADIWHFGDAGHEKFATLITDTVEYWLETKPDQY